MGLDDPCQRYAGNPCTGGQVVQGTSQFSLNPQSLRSFLREEISERKIPWVQHHQGDLSQVRSE